jgi:hypothetical protein
MNYLQYLKDVCIDNKWNLNYIYIMQDKYIKLKMLQNVKHLAKKHWTNLAKFGFHQNKCGYFYKQQKIHKKSITFRFSLADKISFYITNIRSNKSV